MISFFKSLFETEEETLQRKIQEGIDLAQDFSVENSAIEVKNRYIRGEASRGDLEKAYDEFTSKLAHTAMKLHGIEFVFSQGLRNKIVTPAIERSFQDFQEKEVIKRENLIALNNEFIKLGLGDM